MKSPEPTKQTKKDMDFYEALKEIMTGKQVTKKEWGDKNIHGILRDGHLQLHKADGKYYDWILTDGDIYGCDYKEI